MSRGSSVISGSSTRRGSRRGVPPARAGATRLARRASAFAALLILAIGVSGCNKLKARDLLNKGVAAFKNAQYDTAIEDFKQAKDLYHAVLKSRLYPAPAYARPYTPRTPSSHQQC